MQRRFKVELLIDEEVLLKTYYEAHDLNLYDEELEEPSIEEALEFELNWVLPSGIEFVGEPEEIKEWSGNRCSHCFSPLD